MDPNPLQYQQADENEPLYRAAMLSAVAVGIIIFLVLGINFVVRHSKGGPVPTARRDYETSPDDSVNGMRHALSDATDSASSPSFGGGGGNVGGAFPSQSFATTTGQSGVSYGGGQATPSAFVPNGLVTGWSSEPPSVSHTRGFSMRDWGSIDPANLADLLASR